MTIEMAETWDSRQQTLGDSPSVETKWILSGTDDDVAAHAAFISGLAPFYGGLPLQETSLSRLAETFWLGTANYGVKEIDRKTPGYSDFSFDTTGGTAKITQSLATISSYAAPPGVVAPDEFGAIGVTKDGVEGCDVIVPSFKWTEKRVWDRSFLTDDYLDLLGNLTGGVNNATFKRRPSGSVRFDGATGGGKEDSRGVEVTYHFSYSPNRTGLSVGTITGIAKRGWDHLWIRYNDYVDDASKTMVKKPVAAYVEQVLYYIDFNQLGL